MDPGFLQKARAAIDDIDDQLLLLLARRGELAQQVALTKQAAAKGGEVVYYRPEREAEVLLRISRDNPGPYPDAALRSIYREVIASTLALEQPLKVVVVSGPEQLSKLAARNQFGYLALIDSLPSTAKALAAVTNHHADVALIAVEDSVSGLLAEELGAVVDLGLFPVAEVVEMVGGLSSAPTAIRFLAVGRQACDSTGHDRTLLVATVDSDQDLPSEINDRAARMVRLQPSKLDALDSCRWALIVDGHLQDESIQALIADLTAKQALVAAVGSWPVVEKTLFDE